MANWKTIVLIGLCPLLAHGEDRIQEILYGEWNGASRAFEGLSMQIDRDYLSVGQCKEIPYQVLTSKIELNPYGDVQKFYLEGPWNVFALKLEENCTRYRVLVFSIHDNHRCNAQVAKFRTIERYPEGPIESWGIWTNPEKIGSCGFN